MNKKNIMILTTIMLIVIVLVVIFLFIGNKQNKIDTEKIDNTKTSEVYDKIVQTDKIKLVRTVDNSNKVTTIIDGEMAYKEIIKNGIKTKYIVKNGNTYYIDDRSKRYFEYQNNTTILNEIKNELEQIKNTSTETGKEKIDGKSYRYEEFSGNGFFLLNDNLSTNYSKTRFYYDNDKLVYIKIILDEKEEIQKVDLSYDDVNDSFFNIPNDYKKS